MGLLDALFPPNVQTLKAKRNVNGLIKTLRNTSWELRREATAAIGELKAKEAEPALITCMKNDDHRLVRVAAAAALGKIGSEQAEEALIALVERDGDQDVALTLTEFGTVRALTTVLRAYRKHDAAWFHSHFSHDFNDHLNKSGIAALGQILMESTDLSQRDQAARALSDVLREDLRHEVEAALKPALRDPDYNIRDRAFTWFGMGGSQQVSIDLLDDDSPDVRQHATNRLGSYYGMEGVRPDTEVMSRIRRLLLTDPESKVRDEAERVLKLMRARAETWKPPGPAPAPGQSYGDWLQTVDGCVAHLNRRDVSWYGQPADRLAELHSAIQTARRLHVGVPPLSMIGLISQYRCFAHRYTVTGRELMAAPYDKAAAGLRELICDLSRTGAGKEDLRSARAAFLQQQAGSDPFDDTPYEIEERRVIAEILGLIDSLL